MKKEGITKEAWKKFLKVLIPILIINIIFIVLFYLISPEQIPKSGSYGKIDSYQDKNVIFYILYIQFGAIVIGILGYFCAFIYNIYPDFWKRLILRLNSLFLGVNVTKEPFILVMRKYLLSFVLTFSILLFIITLFMFLMFNLPKLMIVLTMMLIIIILVVGFFGIRYFYKMLSN